LQQQRLYWNLRCGNTGIACCPASGQGSSLPPPCTGVAVCKTLCVEGGGWGLFIFPSNYEIEAYAAPKYNEANRDITYEKDSTGTGTYIAGRY
jgi:hypothetical protein